MKPLFDFIQMHQCLSWPRIITLVVRDTQCRVPPKQRKCFLCNYPFQVSKEPSQRIYWSDVKDPERWIDE